MQTEHICLVTIKELTQNCKVPKVFGQQVLAATGLLAPVSCSQNCLPQLICLKGPSNQPYWPCWIASAFHTGAYIKHIHTKMILTGPFHIVFHFITGHGQFLAYKRICPICHCSACPKFSRHDRRATSCNQFQQIHTERPYINYDPS